MEAKIACQPADVEKVFLAVSIFCTLGSEFKELIEIKQIIMTPKLSPTCAPKVGQINKEADRRHLQRETGALSPVTAKPLTELYICIFLLSLLGIREISMGSNFDCKLCCSSALLFPGYSIMLAHNRPVWRH